VQDVYTNGHINNESHMKFKLPKYLLESCFQNFECVFYNKTPTYVLLIVKQFEYIVVINDIFSSIVDILFQVRFNKEKIK
jgi:hypothetical protein